MELVANVLVNATSMANEIRSGDVGIVSSLLDRVSDEIGSNTSDTQDTGGMQVSGHQKISIATVYTCKYICSCQYLVPREWESAHVCGFLLIFKVEYFGLSSL